MSLNNLNSIAKEAQETFNGYKKQEIVLSSEFKREFAEFLKKTNDTIEYSKSTSVLKTSTGLTITFPNQWFFIASYFTKYLDALKEYKEEYNRIFQGLSNAKDIVKQIKDNKKIPEEILAKIDTHFSLDLDKEYFKRFLSDYSWWFGSKTIDRGDYFVSPILSLAKVVNVSQAYIADLASYLSEKHSLLDSLKKSTISEVESDNEEEVMGEKLIEENTSIRDFAINVFKHFYGKNWDALLKQTAKKAAEINGKNFISHNFDIFSRLLAEFPSAQTKEDLTSAKTTRYFEEPVYQRGENYFYFTNQWNGEGDYDLSFDSLKEYFERNNPSYKFEKTDKVFRLLKLDEAASVLFDYKAFQQKTKEAGLMFTEKMVSRFIASLCTKPFVICSGLSGSGKTKLAQSFVQWICQSQDQYKIVAVGADWTNREPLLGYPNGLDATNYVSPDNGALQLIIDASKVENKDKPYFLILDEMNLSHVERYFADFLSIMESHDGIKLYSGDKRGEVPQAISWPKNLFIIGTVNIDETTYMFSPKVLDRANVIEFRISENEIETYLTNHNELDMKKLVNQHNKQGYGSAMAKDFLDKARTNASVTIDAKETLVSFFKELKKCGAEFGYRSASEINRLISVLHELTNDTKKWEGKDIEENDFVDIAIMQKLLPKLHGSRNKLTKVLPVIGSLCLVKSEKIKEDYFAKIDSVNFDGDVNIKYKLSFEKICRMYKNAIENGYASYAEA